jgi:hypothetical protein
MNMLHAKRGVGKTHFGLSIAYAVATGGSFLKWSAPKARKVCYLDGEMSGYGLQERLRDIKEANPTSDLVISNLKIYTPDQQFGPILDISDVSWHDALEEFIGDAELVIVDNLSCLARSTGNENEADSWSVLGDWGLGLRRQGKAVIFLHHDGKNGQQRGTSKKEDILNSVIGLRHPSEYTPDMGALFEVHFEKGRDIYGDDARPFQAQLKEVDGLISWAYKDLEDVTSHKVIELDKLGHTQNEIALELGVNKSTVSRHLKAARETGKLGGKR